MMRIVVIATILSVQWHVSVGFVGPELKAAYMPYMSSKTKLNAFDDDELTLAKQGLKYLLVPDGKDVAATTPSTTVVSPSVESNVASTTKQAVVEIATKGPRVGKVPDIPVETTVKLPPPPPPPVTVEQPPIPVAPSSVAPVKAAVVQQPETVLQIVPRKAVAVADTASSKSYDDVVEAFRQAHLDKMPKIVPTPSSPTKVPSFAEYSSTKMKEMGESFGDSWNAASSSVGSWKATEGANVVGSVQKGDTKLLGDVAREKIQLVVDSDAYNSLKEYFRNPGKDVKSISVQDLEGLLKVDLSGIEKLKATSAASLINAGQQIDQATASVATSYGKFVASLNVLQATLQNNPDDISTVFDAMNLKETAGWYVGATVSLMVMVGAPVVPTFALRKKDRKIKERKIILTDAALPASQPKEESKPAAVEMDAAEIAAAQAEVERKEAVRRAMDEQIQSLKNATDEVYGQLAALQEEKSLRAYEVATMKSELRTVMNRLDLTLTEEQSLRMSLQETQKKLEEETDSLRAELERRAANEEELREQLAETKDKLAAEKKKVKAAQKKSKSKVSMKDVEKLEKEKDELEKAMLSLRSEVADLQEKQEQQTGGSLPNGELQEPTNGEISQLTNGELKEPTNGELKEPTNGAGKKPKKVKSKAATLPTSKSSYSDMAERYFIAISEPIEPENDSSAVRGAKETSTSEKSATATLKKKKTSKKVKKGAKKATKKAARKKAQKTTAAVTPDWTSLSMSALKRKTVKELTAYLEEKGAPTTDSNGKVLKKDFLVQNVLTP